MLITHDVAHCLVDADAEEEPVTKRRWVYLPVLSLECNLYKQEGRQANIPSFLAHDSMHSALYAVACPSVCPSVRLSHGWISQKRLTLGSRNFHRTVASSL